jgi:hypothetical protein
MRIWSDERGMTTLPTVTAASFALVAFLLLANLVLVQYGRGVARTAVDEAVRRSAVGGGNVEMCAGASTDVLSDLLGGPYGAGLVTRCWMTDGAMYGTVEGNLPALVPVLPDAAVVARAAAVVDSG